MGLVLKLMLKFKDPKYATNSKIATWKIALNLILEIVKNLYIALLGYFLLLLPLI